MAKLEAFEDAGSGVAGDFVEGEKIKYGTLVDWIRANEYDALANEMVEMYGELQKALDGKRHKHCLEHLGHGVYAQEIKYGLDRDAVRGSPVTITREESRGVVEHALDVLKSHFAVCVTGQPGIGKTRGCMMYAIQALLYQRAAVLYVGYKSKKMLLFLPEEEGSSLLWSTKANKFDDSFLTLDKRVVAVMDPPEEGS